MERIGRAASRIAKGNRLSYNLCVIGIAFLCALMIFLVTGASIILALAVIGHLALTLLQMDLAGRWDGVIRVCLISLSAVVGVFMILAVAMNLKLPRGMGGAGEDVDR